MPFAAQFRDANPSKYWSKAKVRRLREPRWEYLLKEKDSWELFFFTPKQSEVIPGLGCHGERQFNTLREIAKLISSMWWLLIHSKGRIIRLLMRRSSIGDEVPICK